MPYQYERKVRNLTFFYEHALYVKPKYEILYMQATNALWHIPSGRRHNSGITPKRKTRHISGIYISHISGNKIEKQAQFRKKVRPSIIPENQNSHNSGKSQTRHNFGKYIETLENLPYINTSIGPKDQTGRVGI